MRAGRLGCIALLGLVACAGPDGLEPGGPMAGAYGAERVAVIGAIVGFNQDDPRIGIALNGRTATVTVATYGDGCHTRGETAAHVDGLDALVTPIDHTAPPGTPCTRQLVEMRHVASLNFPHGGTATIRVRGIDARTRHAGNLRGDEIVIERTVTIR